MGSTESEEGKVCTSGRDCMDDADATAALDDLYVNDFEPEDSEQPLLLLEDVCEVSDKAGFSPFGYIIDTEGKMYGLRQQFSHGLVLAILHPDLCEARGYDLPRRHASVFKYQRFMFAVQQKLSYVSYAQGMLGANVTKGDAPATEAQILAVLQIFVSEGIRLEDEVYTGRGPCLASNIEDYLREDERWPK